MIEIMRIDIYYISKVVCFVSDIIISGSAGRIEVHKMSLKAGSFVEVQPTIGSQIAIFRFQDIEFQAFMDPKILEFTCMSWQCRRGVIVIIGVYS